MAFAAQAAVLLLNGCCLCGDGEKCGMMTALSPDGRNEIRLWAAPLAYEVRCGGEVVVAKSEIGMRVNGKDLPALKRSGERFPVLERRSLAGMVETLVYKKARVDLSGNETFVDFGDWGVRLLARNDGVAYRFETRMSGEITVGGETAKVSFPTGDVKSAFHATCSYGCEETPARFDALGSLATNEFAYLPAAFSVNGKFVVVTESDVCDYPVWNLSARGESVFAGFPAETYRSGLAGWDASIPCEKRARWEVVKRRADYLVKTKGTRTFPWRTFILADSPADVMSADIVHALARPAGKGADFSWVKPGKVTWEWWNAWDNIGDPIKGGADGCTTETYRRFFDLAAEYGVEYVIFDEGWSKKLDIWHLNENVDLKGLIEYGNKKGMGTILWMAWGQIVGDEERVAREFAKMGVKGFKVDFMDRGDAACERFYWDFAKACAKYKLVVDYHGAHRPTGLSRAYPNVLNYEGVHGLEQMKFYKGQDILANDVAICFTRMSAGLMDYTPGAMDNYPVGKYPSLAEKDVYTNPGSLGTRCRQMAMMVLYEAPLQMLCDSVKKYRANAECFKFMAKTPVVWDDTVGLGGTPWTYAAIARKAKDGSWYAAAITDKGQRDVVIDTSFLGKGKWTAEIFRDAPDADVSPTNYIHETGTPIIAGFKFKCHLAPGGGFVCRFSAGKE